jgi:hypothetical protein
VILPIRALDPLLAVFTGSFAYYLYETNPRTAVPQEERLSELLRWKWAKWRRERELNAKADETSAWQELQSAKTKPE